MNLYRLFRSYNFPESEVACPYCFTEYLHNSSKPYSICIYCESYVSKESGGAVDLETSKKLKVISASMSRTAYAIAAEEADALSASQNPYILYAVSSFFKSLSDITYWDVDYTLKAFMEKNADNRNDEAKRNRYSAMHFYSKYRECLHKAIALLELSKTGHEEQLFMKFMAEVKLKRYTHAGTTLGMLKKAKGPTAKYSAMVFSVETMAKDAQKNIAAAIAEGESGSLFYMAKYLAMKKEFRKSIQILDSLISKADITPYKYYRQKVIRFSESAGI